MDLSCPYSFYRIDKKRPAFYKLPKSFAFSQKDGGVFVTSQQMKNLVEVFRFKPEDFDKIRCGQCMNCRLNKSREWAVRCSHEALYHKYNYFITLTYNEAFLPKGDFLGQDGEMYDSSLVLEDIQGFLKRYRNFSPGMKVFYCGEYGERTSRPHYHLCIFGSCELTDLTLYTNRSGVIHYTSQFVNDRWSYYDRNLKVFLPMGYATVSEFSFNTAAYVAKYCMKKIVGEQKKDFMNYYASLIDPPELRRQEFIGMSRRPGLGAQFYVDHKDDIYRADSVSYVKDFKSYSSKPPRYYDKLYDIEEPELCKDIKDHRRSLSFIQKRSSSSDTPEEVSRKALERNERVYAKRTKNL